MSIQTEITRLNGIKTTLQSDKNDIATAITAKGVTTDGHGFDDFANDISGIDLYAFWRLFITDNMTIVTEEMLSGLTSIHDYAFYTKPSLKSVTIPNSITSIGSNSFVGCSGLTTFNVPDSVTSLGASTFRSCTGLTSIHIGIGVTEIGVAAFNNCTSLTSFTITASSPPQLDSTNAFTNTNNCPIYVPANSVNSYKNATNWSTYASRIQAIPST